MKIKRVRPYRFTVALFLAAVMTLGFAVDTTKVFAIPDVQFYGSNDILFYDPDGLACQGGSGTLRGGSVKEKIWNYLRDKGLSAEQAAGVMGNMDAESGFVATRRQGSGDLWNSRFTNNAWGLAQWDGGRRYTAPNNGILGKLREKAPDLEKYTAVEYGGTDGNEKVPPGELDKILLFELEYLFAESNSRRVTETRYGKAANEWETLKLQTTVDDATVFWHNNFEVSDDSASTVLNGRGARSQKVFAEFSAVPESTGSSLAAEGNSECAPATGNIQQKTLEYAWPQYHPKGYVQKKPEYEEGVKKARSEGRYLGDPCFGGGVDCGAFVTLLVNDSGFDPAYNHNGKGGFTEIQRAWAEKNWQTLGNGSSIDVAELRPGDVAHLEGHTFLYVGTDIPGFGEGDNAFKGVASASQCGRAPMAGHESMTSGSVTWFRKK